MIKIGSEGELKEELRNVRPYASAALAHPIPIADIAGAVLSDSDLKGEDEGEDDGDDVSLRKDIADASRFCAMLSRDERLRKEGGKPIFDDIPFQHGADLLVETAGKHKFAFPVHRVVLAVRSTVLSHVLRGQATGEDGKVCLRYVNGSKDRKQTGLVFSSSMTPRLVVSGCHPLSVVIFIDFLYSDDVLAIWDRRIGLAIEKQVTALHTSVTRIRSDLQALALLCDLPRLTSALGAHVKRSVTPAIHTDMSVLFNDAQRTQGTIVTDVSSPLAPDTILELQDKKVFCHSTILRARSPFFAGFFDDADWTAGRWRPDGTVVVNLKHMRWREMEYVMRYVYCDGRGEMFDVLGMLLRSIDDFGVDVSGCFFRFRGNAG